MRKILLLFSLCLFALVGKAQPGTPDPTFNVGSGFNNTVSVSVTQPDGKIVVGGYFTSFNGTVRNNIARLNADGSLDTSFNLGTGFGPGSSNVVALAIQPDGKILVGGFFTAFNGAVCNSITRLNADGSLDTAFNLNIGTGANFQSTYSVESLYVLPNGKILVGGSFNFFNNLLRPGLVRLNENGSLDMSFTAPNLFVNGNGNIKTIDVQSDGKIVVGGWTAPGSIIARLNVDGSLDSAFSTNTGTGVNNSVEELYIQPDGKIVMGGWFATFNETPCSRIARLNTDGSLDTSFNIGTGFGDLPNGSNNFIVKSLDRQSDGKIVVGGEFRSFNGILRSYVARLNTDGSLDTNFDSGAWVGTSGSIYVNSLHVQANDRIVVGGYFTSVNGSTYNNIVRLNSATITTLVPEINLTGNSVAIADGDTSPTATDHTDFGLVNASTNSVRTFTIQNVGTATLNINTIGNSNTADFAIGGITLPTTIVPAGSKTFTVTLNSATEGAKTATITINNDDANEASYDFAIRGTISEGYVTIANGNWNNAATWKNGAIPASDAQVTIAHIVDLNTNYNTGAYTLTIQNNKSINIKNAQTLTIASGGKLVNVGTLINNVGSTLINQGILNNNGILQCWESFTNHATLQNNGIINNTKTFVNVANATFINQGILNNNANGTLNNNGVLDSNGGVFTNNAGATLTGTGVYEGTLVNDGTFAPGTSIGIFTIAGTFINNGTLRIEVGGIGGAGTATGHDKIQVNGDAILGGTIEVLLVNSFVPVAVGIQTYNFINTTESITGTFATSTFPNSTGVWLVTLNNFKDANLRNVYTYTSVAHGNWDSYTTWQSGIIPASNAPVIIAHEVDLNTNYNTGAHTVTIQSGKALNVKNAKTLTIATGGTIVNSGALTNTAGSFVINQGTINNGGTLNVGWSLNNQTTINNTGIINNTKTFTNVAGATVANQNIINNNTGGSWINNGSINGGTGVFNNNTGATLGGSGTYTGSLVNDGTFSPGNSPGVFKIIGSFTNNGILNIEIGGNGGAGVPTGHDQLLINGNAVLGGTVNITVINGYVAPHLFTFNFITASSIAGAFDVVNVPTAGWSVPVTNTTADATYHNPLSVNILELKAKRLENLMGELTEEVRLTWATTSEINNKGFEVEMSEDERTYEKVAFVDGKGNSSSTINYEFNVRSPYSAYYRLKQVDFDGNYKYSSVVFVEGLAGKVVVYPNPNKGAFTISGIDTRHNPLSAYLLNAQGVEVWRGLQTEVRTTGLVAGVYFLHTTVAGKTSITKVVITR